MWLALISIHRIHARDKKLGLAPVGPSRPGNIDLTHH